MRIFIVTMAVLALLMFFVNLLFLAHGDLPPRTSNGMAFDVLINAVIFLWAVVVLMRHE